MRTDTHTAFPEAVMHVAGERQAWGTEISFAIWGSAYPGLISNTPPLANEMVSVRVQMDPPADTIGPALIRWRYTDCTWSTVVVGLTLKSVA